NGNLSGDIDLLLDDRNAANSEGHLDLSVASAALNAGPVPVPGMGALTLPRVELGEVVAKASVRDGKLTFDRLDANSQDLEASGEGLYCILQPRMAFARIFGKAHLRIHDALWAKRGATGYKGIVEMALAQARSQDGAYGFQIFGTLSQPQARMAP
ncbi:MAG TPA: type II secretion system protein GspN, partial [Anaeromyxobacteraceae bacterium]|nr:type II secretion system protein GspN [Anaeromyxobacteraceae bacterium]